MTGEAPRTSGVRYELDLGEGIPEVNWLVMKDVVTRLGGVTAKNTVRVGYGKEVIMIGTDSHELSSADLRLATSQHEDAYDEHQLALI